MTIFLCGFMGCGKSAMGKALSRMLRLPLIDTDEAIVKQEGMSIPDIFEKQGESYFRRVEAEIVQNLCKKSAVVACGGGAMLNPDTASAARKAGAHIAFINQSFPVCYSRIKNDKNRPLVQKNTEEQLHEIFDSRATVYKAHSTIIVEPCDTPEATARRLIKLMCIPMPTAAVQETK